MNKYRIVRNNQENRTWFFAEVTFMGIFITELAEHGSLVNFCVLFFHRTLRVHEVRTLRGTKQVDHRSIARGPIQLHEIILVEPYRTRISRREVRPKLAA